MTKSIPDCLQLKTGNGLIYQVVVYRIGYVLVILQGILLQKNLQGVLNCEYSF